MSEPMNLGSAVEHIIWTVEKSPKTYAANQHMLNDLRAALVNAELRHRELMDTQNVSNTPT